MRIKILFATLLTLALFTAGYAQINAAEKKPLTAANRFRIASITKTFTAVMILQLVEEGKLKLTDTLDKFFPQVPNSVRRRFSRRKKVKVLVQTLSTPRNALPL